MRNSRVSPLASRAWLSIALVGGCVSTASPTPAASVPVAVARAPRAPATPAKADVESLVARWLAAQNGADFAAYEALYASEMSGIKRAGPRTYRMERRGWLDDRKRMFEHPQQVGAENLRVSLLPGAASVTFVQTYSSAGFEDRGEKRLVLMAGKTGLRIVAEEMLASSVIADRPATPEAGFYFVVHADQPYVVLEQQVDPSWSVDKARRMHVKVEVPGEFPVYVTRIDVSAALPADRKALVGRRLKVVDAAGRSCEATVGELTTLAVLVPSVLERQWLGTYQEDDEPPAPPWTDEAIDESIAGSAASDGGLLLAAPLTSCDGEFALDAGRSVKVLGALTPLSPEASQPVLEAAHHSKVYETLDAEYKAGGVDPDRPHWYRWEEVRGSTSHQVVRANALDPYIGPYGVLFGVFEPGTPGPVLKSMTPSLVTSSRISDRLVPQLLIDLDEDGTPEIMTRLSDFLGRTLISFPPEGAALKELHYADMGCYD